MPKLIRAKAALTGREYLVTISELVDFDWEVDDEKALTENLLKAIRDVVEKGKQVHGIHIEIGLPIRVFSYVEESEVKELGT